MSLDDHSEEPTAIRTNLGAIFVSLELSRSTWLITSVSPGCGEKMSKHGVSAGNIAALLARLSELKQKAFARTGKSLQVVAIQEAGLDGFWIHRVLQSEGVESHVVDAASIATSWRRRRAKTDKIDGEALVRALLAYKRGEPRVCAMVRAPTPEDEDRRRLCRERKTLTNERVQHVNRIKGLLFSQGISDYEPLRRDRRQRLDELKSGDARPLPPHLKAQITRELDRLELLLEQIKVVEIERDALISAMKPEGMNADAARSPPAMLINLNGIGPEIVICMTNIGVLDAARLSFGDLRPTDAYLCGSIKYKPYFQLAMSSYQDELTLSVNLYGSASDRALILSFSKTSMRNCRVKRCPHTLPSLNRLGRSDRPGRRRAIESGGAARRKKA